MKPVAIKNYTFAEVVARAKAKAEAFAALPPDQQAELSRKQAELLAELAHDPDFVAIKLTGK